MEYRRKSECGLGGKGSLTQDGYRSRIYSFHGCLSSSSTSQVEQDLSKSERRSSRTCVQSRNLLIIDIIDRLYPWVTIRRCLALISRYRTRRLVDLLVTIQIEKSELTEETRDSGIRSCRALAPLHPTLHTFRVE